MVVQMCPRYDSVSADQRPDWQEAYRAALLEIDPAKLRERIEQADKAIHDYIDLARQDNSSGAERQALADALANLRVLRREVNLKANDPGRGEPDAPAAEH